MKKSVFASAGFSSHDLGCIGQFLPHECLYFSISFVWENRFDFTYREKRRKGKLNEQQTDKLQTDKRHITDYLWRRNTHKQSFQRLWEAVVVASLRWLMSLAQSRCDVPYIPWCTDNSWDHWCILLLKFCWTYPW